jgi:hypothetical protein
MPLFKYIAFEVFCGLAYNLNLFYVYLVIRLDQQVLGEKAINVNGLPVLFLGTQGYGTT